MQHVDFPNEFLDATQADWEAAALKALKGAGLDALVSKGGGDLPVKPLYLGAADSAPLQLREAGAPWKIIARADHPNIQAANAQILEDLEGGADGIELVLPSSSRAFGTGLSVQTLDDMIALLNNVQSNLITWRLECGYEGSAVLALLVEACKKQGVTPSQLTVDCVSDPFSVLARNGRIGDGFARLEQRGHDLCGYAHRQGLKGAQIRADGRYFHDTGADSVQELGLTLSSLIFFLRSLEVGGIPQEQLTRSVTAVLSATANQFETIIKARAMRLLWARLLEASQLPQVPLLLHMETSWRMMSKRDPWVNMLRTTVAAFAAGIGGADSVCVLPFTQVLGLPNSFARRMARNTQLILIEESQLAQVGDPGAGSGLIEERTQDLAAAAWAYFQRLEAQGGMYEAMQKGTIASDIHASGAAEAKLVATGRQPLTGTSAFPNLAEAEVDVDQAEITELGASARRVDLPAPTADGALIDHIAAALRDGAGLADIHTSRSREGTTKVAQLTMSRLAEPFEDLRDRADACQIATGSAPHVFLATLGSLADHTARATYATNFFATGGFQSTGNQLFDGLAAMVEAFRQSNAKIACLCGSDRIYGEQADAAIRDLKAAGAERIVIAGGPNELVLQLKQSGLNSVIARGANMLEELNACFDVLGFSAAHEVEAL